MQPTAPRWRPMRAEDLTQVVAVSQIIHPDLSESLATQASRQALFPEGCIVLEDGKSLLGYLFAHPIARNCPPSLDRPLQHLPDGPSQLYLHDLALLPQTRGSGLARRGVELALTLGQLYPETVLISVYQTAPFWARFGFVESAALAPAKLASYGPDARFMCRKR